MSFEGDGEFQFWAEPALRYHVNINPNRAAARQWTTADDDCSCYPSSPLLPRDHRYSYPSPSMRSRAIEQGQRELMDMIRGLPESSFELSLRDIVDEQRILKDELACVQAADKKQKGGKKRKKAKATGGLRMDRCRVARTSSMESGTFMIKMFFPAFFTTSRKAAPSKGVVGTRSISKVSPRTSIVGIENRDDRESSSKKPSAEAEQKIHRNSKSRSIGSSRCSEDDTFPSCWPFQIPKGKMRRQRTCNF